MLLKQYKIIVASGAFFMAIGHIFYAVRHILFSIWRLMMLVAAGWANRQRRLAQHTDTNIIGDAKGNS